MSTCDPRDINPYQITNGNILTVNVPANNYYTSISAEISQNKEIQEMMRRIEQIEERLAIINPNVDLMSRFPALYEAYEHYKVIEKLVNDQSKIHG